MSKHKFWFLPVLILILGAFHVAGEDEECLSLPYRQGSFRAPGGSVNSSGPNPFELRVVSLNVAGETSADRVLGELDAFPGLSDADVYFLQEVDEYPADDLRLVVDWAEEGGLHFVFAPAQRRSDGRLHGLAFLSRFPLTEVEIMPLPRFDLNYRTRCRIALAATVLSPSGKVRLFNLHLDTRINSEKRLEQLEPVLEAARDFRGPAVLGGDLNTGDVYWVQHMFPIPFAQKQSRRLRESIEAQGFVTPFSGGGKTHAWAPLKLDWIFVKGLASMEHGLEKVRFSDHRALWTRIRLHAAE